MLVLTMLKINSHKFLDGHVKEGEVNWNKNSVMNVLLNEKRCGHVDAQKTITLNYLDHNVAKNVNGKAPRYYETKHHRPIVRPTEFFLTQRYHSARELFESNNAEIAASKSAISSEADTASDSCEHTPSGEFDDLILADLIKEGYDGDALLSEFRARRARVRPAVEKLLKQAEDAAKGIGEYSTLEEVFGKPPANSE